MKDLHESISADIVDGLDAQEAAEPNADPQTLAAIRIIEQMGPDEVADLPLDLALEIAQIILSRLERPEDIAPLMIHSDETAGGLTTSEFTTLRPQMRVSQALDILEAGLPDPETFPALARDRDEALVRVIKALHDKN